MPNNKNPDLKVYLPNKGPHDYSAASKFGTLITLTTGSLQLTQVGYLYRACYPILAKSSPDDYILLCGPTLANIIACSIFATLHGKINLLIYRSHRTRGDIYYKRTLYLGEDLTNFNSNNKSD